jgi:hypothetical protein
MDPRLTFEGFVVGPSNRLAAAAARRVADSPGAAYNPLFIYAASGLGKTHLLMAVGSAIRRANAKLALMYAAIEPLAEELSDPADGDAFRARLQSARVLLLDDVQALAERHDLQEDLLAVWDAVAARGGQIALASDRPPGEIPGLDQRLVSRFSGGLVADIAPPTHEERVSIVRRKAEHGAHRLAAGVPDVIARIAFGNVREVHGALNRVLAIQEVEQRLVTAGEIPQLLGSVRERREQEFSNFVADIEGAVDELVVRHSPEQRIAEAILRYEGEGYRTTRLEVALKRAPSPESAEQLIRVFAADIARLEEVATAIRATDPRAPELARVDLLLDPDRAGEAALLVERVRERVHGTAAAPAPNGRSATPAAATPANRAAQPRREPAGDVRDAWFLAREKVLWTWPYVEDWIVAEQD